MLPWLVAERPRLEGLCCKEIWGGNLFAQPACPIRFSLRGWGWRCRRNQKSCASRGGKPNSGAKKSRFAGLTDRLDSAVFAGRLEMVLQRLRIGAVPPLHSLRQPSPGKIGKRKGAFL